MAKINLALPDDLQAEVDAARGDVPRTRWIIRAIEAALASRADDNQIRPDDLPYRSTIPPKSDAEAAELAAFGRRAAAQRKATEHHRTTTRQGPVTSAWPSRSVSVRRCVDWRGRRTPTSPP